MTLARLAGWLPVLPGVMAHEAAHALVARVLGASVALTRTNRLPAVQMDWPAETPRAAVRVAHLAPTLLSPVALLGLLVLVDALGTMPLNPFTLTGVALLAVGNTAAFAWPSASDRNPEGL